MASASGWFLLLYLGSCAAWMDERPVLEARDGHLVISSARDRNITLKTMGGGYVNVNEINLLHVASAAQNATRVIDRWQRGYLAVMENSLEQLTTIVTGPSGLQKRIALLERGVDTNGTYRPGNRSRTLNYPMPGFIRNSIRRINVRLKALEDMVRSMQTLLRENECQSNPCQNGGTCEDLYDGYQCHCTLNWEGPNCMTDVNECARFLGTDLGCQNRATCRNLPGSYRCDCLPGWFGLHCTQKTSICNTENSEALCGEHGVCVEKSGSSLGYTCICDQGWQNDGASPACTKDVDECAADHPPCSVNPPVPCRNTRGSFTCGACPHGYSGNGYYCTDIDECLINNGGCSTSPYVQCMNTMGSRVCGACPSGYRGDGISCIFVGGCAINNGGCHPLATCTENPSLTSSYVLCRCPPGYIGNGMGPNGCQLSDVSFNTACASNPCVYGRCTPNGANDFTCTCNPGYSGITCNTRVDPCSPNPCRNNGVCQILDGQATCQCRPSFTGSRCETPRQSCGGVSRNPTGRLQFPMGGSTYQHGLSCAWVLITEPSKVLNVTFAAFNLEHSTDCKFDFLQIHDGRNAGSQMINRFCGDTLPNGNGNIVSSHNTLYLWFHSDSSVSHDGFTFEWNSIDPVCGGVLENNYGTITSPGSPGRYPPNRDCLWTINGAPSKRIQFHFGLLMLEEHPTCESDYLEITGIDDERLGLFCNHTRPPPLITPSSEAKVHFHSDSAGQDAGFQIHYSLIEGIPGCGGTYTSPTGTISSPGHASSSYEPNMECEWKIQLPAGERIRASWLRFDLEHSNGCQFDFVEIYDGSTTDSQLLGRYCGSDTPPSIKSNSNTIVVIFKSDWSYELEGFVLSYEALCGGEFHEPTGILKSPFYPNTYHGSRTCTYEIVQPANKGIVLTIEDLDIEGRDPPDCYYDYLEIYDGDNENATKLATLCGDEQHIPTEPYYSMHNYMYLKFTTDNSVEGRGFKVNYTTIDRRCGGLLKESNQVIQPPTENGIYANNEQCIWTIQAPPGYVIQLSWLSFNLEYHAHCIHDYVNIYENYTSPEEDVVATYCGTNKPPDITTQTRTLTILFHTDSSITNDGFVATYIFVDVTKMCGGYFTTPNGVIKSPNYPGYYPNKKECVWIVEARNKHRIVLTVEHFELEEHSGCGFDYLEIRNGGYESAPLIGRFCGTEIPAEIPSQTNQMYVKFVSDFSRSMEGFYIRWDSTTTGCGGTMNAVTGAIMSPNYPEPYQVNADCYWKIAVAAGSFVQLEIVDFDLEDHSKCRYDFLEVFEGTTHRTDGRRYCGTTYPKVIQAKSNQMTIRFRSDFSTSGRGFYVKYETQCHNKLHGYYGVIESPNFPNKYEHSTNCSWIIEAPIGNTINLTFSHFDLEGNIQHITQSCQYDYLQISEGDEDTPNTELDKLCGSIDLPKKINSTQHQVFITFITDRFVAFNGFRLEWTVNGCGGHLTRPFDSFTSPRYPSSYPMNVDCEWLIEVDHTYSVELTFHNVDTEKRKGCSYDKIQIYGGEDANAPKLIELCHSDKPVVYTSPGNKMFVKFHSDQSYAGRGFNASYRSVPIQCGGRFTANSGIIHSANYPQNYPHAQDCEWLLEVDRNHLINLTFLDFDIENSRNCSDDYVKIFDGPTKDDPLLGSHCHNQLPPTYVSSSNEMLVIMRTDSLISAKGFKARYSRSCGARIIVKDHGFLTSSPGYINIDEHSANCTWTLIAENPADHVTVTFTHMEIDPLGIGARLGSYLGPCFLDYVQVFEGEGMDGPLLGKWCDNVTPPPVTSTGSSLTVHLYNANEELLGNFAASYSILNTACGGNYTSEQGTITSPGYPNSYPLNAECIWILNTSPGNKVTLTFSEFDVESSENCDLDYLEIRENSGIGKLVSVSCGKDAASITHSGVLWIKFKSDGSGTAKGFVAEYNYIGGNELEGPTGRITSPLYPLPYKRTADITWRITVDTDMIVRIEFRDLQIENFVTTCFSSVKLFDGYDNEAPLLLEACGYFLPDPVVSSSNVIFIEMKSDYFAQGGWFDLTWLQIPRVTSENNKETKLSKCDTEVALTSDRNNTYTFSSPGWPTGYAANLHCNWVFTSPPGTHLVLRIIIMNLEETNDCIADSLSVYSGYALTSTDNAKLESKLCLSNSTGTLVKASNVMTVKFVSDAFVNKTGFNAYVYRDCGGELTGPNGVIEYDNSSFTRGIHRWQFTCEWIVTVKPGRTIKVQITDMSILETPDHTCGINSLLLKNGNGMLSPLLGNGKYCGNVLPPELETTGNYLYVKATGNGPFLNFKLAYREVSINCGGEFILTDKQNTWEISTPNYPNIPPTYSECTWKASAPAGERLSIHFPERFDLSNTKDCQREFVEIRDGGTDSSRPLGRFCKDVAPSTMTTTGNMMYIYFYTDIPEPKNGFKAVITSGETCGGILRGNSGIIKSPNYPHRYPKNKNCTWIIIGPTEHTLKLEFRDIHLPGFHHCESNDRVEITEKIKLDVDVISKIGTYCGLNKPDIIETSSNEVYVRFESDSRDYINYRGFSINFTASQETCGGSLTALSGIIKSPGYPHPRIRPRYCDWRIELPMGYQVVVDILDIDIINEFASTGVGYALSFYNDFRFKSKIRVLGQSSSTEEIRSSSNTMLVAYWSSVGHRGFKLRYSAQAPAPCGGHLREPTGNITGPMSLPFNESSYVCHWKLEPPESMIDFANNTGSTMTIKVTGFLGGSDGVIVQNFMMRSMPRNCFLPQYIELKDIGIMCRNLTEPAYLRSPKVLNELTIINGTYGKRMNVNLEYQWQPCGGILQGPSHTIKAPKNIPYPVNCAWHMNYPAGETIKLTFTKLQLDFNCDRAYFIIRNGGTMAPQIEKLCGHAAHSGHEINSISNQLWIEYFSSGNSSDFEFKSDVVSTGCGGSLHGPNREISSPQFPKQYPNNSECTWEIIGDNGYHIGLAFIDRFSLETSPDCEKDYVEVFDWVRKDGDYGNGEWKSLGKVCGRNTPAPFNSTANRMKVIFHSNEAVQSDGFRAVWSENCGGVFEATERTNIIQSPSYPSFYPPNALCNYTIVAPNQDIIVEFTDFQLERGRVDCRFDNVTVITESLSKMEDVESYCDNRKPPLLRSTSQIQIIFMTDRYVQRTGFQFKYFINKCGGIITKPTELKPLMHGEEYFGLMNCTWIIKAPQGKSVLVRFEKFILEYSVSCYFDNVAVYEGDLIKPDKRLGLICGNLTKHLPTFKSTSNSMVVNFNADNSRHFEGFTAKVLFVTSPADSCGKTIDMTSIRSESFRTQLAATYQPFEECHWSVVTSPDKKLKLTINNMDIRNWNNTQSDTCTGDYLEVRDGGGLYSELVGQYCGNVPPLPIVSASNKLWIRLYTDGTIEGTGATATLDVIDSLCGSNNRLINDTVKVLTSPGYPNTYSPGIKCRWTLRHPDEYNSRLRIRFTDFDMEDSSKCENEYVEISEHNEFISEGFGTDFVFAGTKKHPITVELASRTPYASYKYCGTELPHEYYSYGNELQVTFRSASSGHKGFKLEYSTATCDRNYTSEQGRISHHGFTSCWISITAPANRTISLYFNQFSIYDAEHCTHNALQIHDGDSSGPLITTMCSLAVPSPIFSTGNKLTLHSWTESPSFYQSYDIIYTTTDAGRGCGGRIFNYGGRFTSPLYPNVYRNNTVCTWDVSVPRGFKIILQFLVFDIGTRRNCENNNLKVYDVVRDDQLLRSTYCGGDDPATFEAETNRVLVQFTSTVNNVGTGWVIAFMAQSMEHPIDVLDSF